MPHSNIMTATRFSTLPEMRPIYVKNAHVANPEVIPPLPPNSSIMAINHPPLIVKIVSDLHGHYLYY